MSLFCKTDAIHPDDFSYPNKKAAETGSGQIPGCSAASKDCA